MKHERLSRVKVIPDRYKLKPAVVPKAVEMRITIPSIQSSGRITPPPSLQTLLFILAASTLFTLHERKVFYLLHSLGASNYEINQHVKYVKKNEFQNKLSKLYVIVKFVKI